MKKLSLFLLLVFGCWTFQSCNSNSSKDSAEQAEEVNDDKETVDDDDSEFAVTAASGGMLEVELGRMAQEKAQSQKVKDFGAMMVTEHTKANEELKTVAAAKNITLPATMSDEHQKHVDDLAKLSGADFDKKYIDMMVDDHQKDEKLFDDAAENAKDPDLKAFAAKTAPVIKKHLSAVKALDEAM